MGLSENSGLGTSPDIVEVSKTREAPGILLVEYNNNVIGELARAGKDEYKKYLERIRKKIPTS